ncbi:hypothetical protein POMI540_2718 [Schizosaccharomyces pombe]
MPAPYKNLDRDTKHTHPKLNETERNLNRGWGDVKKEELYEDLAQSDADKQLAEDKMETKYEKSKPAPSD